eukprot:766748-Hanusia_phi.AAC.19
MNVVSTSFFVGDLVRLAQAVEGRGGQARFALSIMHAEATLVMVAKYPAPGRCKSRLAKDIGDVAAAEFARSSLLDLIERFVAYTCKDDKHSTTAFSRRILLYAPEEARADFTELLSSSLSGKWESFELKPMQGISTEGKPSGQGSDLGAFLADALERFGKERPILFIGTDCLTLTDLDVHKSILEASSGSACMCPAADGGYVALSLPPGSSRDVFANVTWSSRCLPPSVPPLPLLCGLFPCSCSISEPTARADLSLSITGKSQVQALEAAGLTVRLKERRGGRKGGGACSRGRQDGSGAGGRRRARRSPHSEGKA